MQRQTTTHTSNEPTRGLSRKGRMLAVAGALGLAVGMTACGEDEAALEDVQTPVTENGQTPAGQEDEPTTATSTVPEENVDVVPPEQSNGDALPANDAQVPPPGDTNGAAGAEPMLPEEDVAPPEEPMPAEEGGTSPEDTEERVSPDEL